MSNPNGTPNAQALFPSAKSELWRSFDAATLANADALHEAPRPDAVLAAEFLRKVGAYHAALGGGHLVVLDGYRIDAGALQTPFAKAGGGAPVAWTDAVEENYFYAANARYAKDAGALVIPEGAAVDGTIHVWFAGSDAARGAKCLPRLSLWAQKGSSCRVMLHTASAERGFLNAVLAVRADEGARVRLSALDEAAEGSLAFSAARMDLARGARVEYAGIMLGAGTALSDMRVRLSGPGASVSLSGLSVLSGSARMHNHTVVTHASPQTSSAQLFKDILAGRARSEYSGLVHVTRDAAKTESNQLCRNLLLSDDARARSQPQLRIDTDDVKCAHGSATGQLPPQEIFYLRSRGLTVEQARTMLIRGFADEVVFTLPEEDPAVRKDVRAAVRRELERVAGLRPEEALR